MALGHGHHEVVDAHDHGAVVAESAALREPFGVAQALAIALGIFFVVTGAVALSRVGADDLTRDRTQVAGLGMTGLLALIHIGIGLLAALGATTRGASRGVLFLIGPALVSMGIIALIEPIRALGWNQVTGVAYLIIGGAALLAAILTPFATVAERRVTSL